MSVSSLHRETTDSLIILAHIHVVIQQSLYVIVYLPPSSQSTGWSALFFSAEREDVATTQSLLTAGANVHLKDKVDNYNPHFSL